MADLTVQNLADAVGTPVTKLLLQMKDAGLSHSSEKDLVTEEDKKVLLESIRKQSKSSKTISLKKKDSETPSNVVKIRRKTVAKKTVSTENTIQEDSSVPNFDEIERKRLAGEESKKSKEEEKKKEIEKKTLVKRKKARSQDIPKPTTQKDTETKGRKPKGRLRDKENVSKKEQRELEGEEFLNKQMVSQHQFEKPTDAVIKTIQVPETITVSGLAKELSIKSSEVVKRLMEMGVMATLNQTLDQDTAILVTEELGHKGEASKVKEEEDQLKELITYEGEEVPRNPVISVLGHVDHGKTTLLDYIRKAKVAEQEHGGITQKIGAYRAQISSDYITFIDTPGHAAFTEVRARGANSTDIVVLVVAADDGLQPQTEEAISHAKAANVPIVVAINKIDKDGVDIEKVKNELSSKDIVSEEWGGKVQMIPVSALTGKGIDDLLEAILLEAEVLELKSYKKGPASGVVLDSTTERGQGAVATVIVQKGTLQSGDIVLVGDQTKKVRNLLDENGKKLDEAGPSVPVQVTGLENPPKAGEEFVVVSNEKMAKEISSERADKQRVTKLSSKQAANLENLFSKETTSSSLNLILKVDTYGSLEAITGSINNIDSNEVKVNIVHGSVGGINANDINLAITTESSVIGFNVRTDSSSKSLAEENEIQIYYASIIYDLLDLIKELVEGKLEPEIKEEILGLAEVKDTFRSPQFGLIAGSIVIEGTIKRNKYVRVIRDDVVIFEGLLDSLRRFKDDASEVASGTECGIGIENYSDVKVGDKIEVFDKKEIKRKLS
ncbi:MAG: translation initiation factor IF-2 [Pseudomonadota bacterium]|nr:translation initiation factor IF-2 [Pseudomonadota bacterium]|tara:strand:- start:773 stop:3118 length:2346 start_codon:yes stop_codon:yes gene_type:complete